MGDIPLRPPQRHSWSRDAPSLPSRPNGRNGRPPLCCGSGPDLRVGSSRPTPGPRWVWHLLQLTATAPRAGGDKEAQGSGAVLAGACRGGPPEGRQARDHTHPVPTHAHGTPCPESHRVSFIKAPKRSKLNAHPQVRGSRNQVCPDRHPTVEGEHTTDTGVV